MFSLYVVGLRVHHHVCHLLLSGFAQQYCTVNSEHASEVIVLYNIIK